jgi:hypothetical protein
LAGTNLTLFTGKAKVEKAHSNEAGPKAVNKWVYFINHDWNLPIGYVWLTARQYLRMELSRFHVAFWVRGDSYQFDPHIFYQGKEVGRISIDGTIAGSAGCEAEVENNTTHYVEDSMPQKPDGHEVICSFPNIKGADKAGNKPSPSQGQVGDIFLLANNPGDYEVKVLRSNKLARSLRFTVAAGGSFRTTALAKNRQLGRDSSAPSVSDNRRPEMVCGSKCVEGCFLRESADRISLRLP